MEMRDWVQDSRQMNLATNVTKVHNVTKSCYTL
jgi:hypothetical protein